VRERGSQAVRESVRERERGERDEEIVRNRAKRGGESERAKVRRDKRMCV